MKRMFSINPFEDDGLWSFEKLGIETDKLDGLLNKYNLKVVRDGKYWVATLLPTSFKMEHLGKIIQTPNKEGEVFENLFGNMFKGLFSEYNIPHRNQPKKHREHINHQMAMHRLRDKLGNNEIDGYYLGAYGDYVQDGIEGLLEMIGGDDRVLEIEGHNHGENYIPIDPKKFYVNLQDRMSNYLIEGKLLAQLEENKIVVMAIHPDKNIKNYRCKGSSFRNAYESIVKQMVI